MLWDNFCVKELEGERRKEKRRKEKRRKEKRRNEKKRKRRKKGEGGKELTVSLDSALAETDKVSTNSHRTPSDESNCENLFVGQRGLPSDQSRATQVFHTKSVLRTDDICDDPPTLFLNICLLHFF
jgi:hypothetical protein